MMIGAHTPSSRSRRQVSKPSMPGSITSSTTASNSVAAAIHSASSPVDARSATMPSACKPAPDGRGHPLVVLDDQNPHRANFIGKR